MSETPLVIVTTLERAQALHSFLGSVSEYIEHEDETGLVSASLADLDDAVTGRLIQPRFTADGRVAQIQRQSGDEREAI